MDGIATHTLCGRSAGMRAKLKVLDLFSGIGGFSLGLERTGGFETVAFCEIEPFPRKVLAKHWPKVPIYDDVRTLTKDILDRDGIAVDVICGGFPCQDISVAGNQKGMGKETRSGLWSEILRLACEIRPQYIIVENVAVLLAGPNNRPGAWFGRVLGDLAECGYDAEWENISAAAVGAHHRRERVWIVAYPDSWRLGIPTIQCERQGGTSTVGASTALANPNSKGPQGQQETGNAGSLRTGVLEQLGRCADGIGATWQIEPELGRVADGIPDRSHRLKALGNAVVPQIPELIGNAILQWGGDIRKEKAA